MVGGIGGRGGIKIASASTLSANEPAEDFIFNPHSTAKTNDKSRRMVSSGISDAGSASVLEKTRLKKLMKMMNKLEQKHFIKKSKKM